MLVQIFLPSSPYLGDPLTNVPLGPLYVAAGAQKLGHEVVLTSLLEGNISDEDVAPADVFMIGFVTPQFDEAVRLCHHIRRIHPGSIIIAGGPHPTVRPNEVLRAGFDLVVIGEADNVLEEVLSRAKKGGIIVGPLVQRLDLVPFPARRLLAESHLQNDSFAVMKRDYGTGITSLMCSRGCPYDCTFCANAVAGKRTRFRSPENILDEVQEVIEDFGISTFKIQDDTFTLRKDFVFALSKASQGRFGTSVVYRAHTRVDDFDEEVARSLLAMNVRTIGLGFESGSQTVLDKAKKHITVEQNLHAAKIAREAGFDVVIGFILFGLPGESHETVEETKRFLEEIRPYVDVIDLSTAIPYPGSAIGDYPERFDSKILCQDYRRYWTVNQGDVIFLPSGMSVEEYKELRLDLFRHLIQLGWIKEEWKHDAIAWLLDETQELSGKYVKRFN